MEPTTIAGLVLGVIPLLISAVENYEVTFQPLVTYQRHAKEIRRFVAKLDAQRAIFHNECQLLLLVVGQNLTDILRDPNHPARKDEQLPIRLKELLGSSYSTCISTLTLINDTLTEVLEETKDFESLVDGKKSKGKSTLFLFRQKVKISFSKSRLTDSVNDLRLYNEDLRRLSSQIQKLASNSAQSSQPVASIVTSHLQVTQQASNRLYDVLANRWACDDRVEHVASMSLNVEEKCQHSASKVRFNMAIICINPPLKCEPLWLAIESAPSDHAQDSSPDKHTVALQASLQKMGAINRVRFAMTSSAVTNQMTTSSSRPQISEEPQVDLCTIGRLCQYFQHVQTQAGSSEPCLGFLERTRTFKHFVYRSPESRQRSGDSKFISLKQILQSDTDENREADWVEKLRLARLLALGVLRFHDTKWLPENWDSNNVRFIGEEVLPERHKLLNAPCLNAKLSNTSTQNRQITQFTTNASSLATNETLFNLGIVLIELGYNAPFESLSRTSGLQVGTNSQVGDFIAARRLGETVHRKLNMTYGRLVERCLNCNFGVATKLDDVELQSAVVVQVVNQLDICLEQYRAFNLLAPLPARV